MTTSSLLKHMLKQIFMMFAILMTPSCNPLPSVSKEQPTSSSTEEESSTPPVDITGTYLSCNIADDNYYASGTADSYVGCSIKNISTNKPIPALNVIGQEFSWGYQSDVEDQISYIKFDQTNANNSYHAIFRFSGMKDADDTVLAKIADTRIKFEVATTVSSGTNTNTISSPFANLTGFVESTGNKVKLLPEYFNVYIAPDYKISTLPVAGYTVVALPTINLYKKTDGCYFACYSTLTQGAVYPIDASINVMGQIRVQGNYENQAKCDPTAFLGKDISAEQGIKQICTDNLSTCPNKQCWGGGDTYRFLYPSATSTN